MFKLRFPFRHGCLLFASESPITLHFLLHVLVLLCAFMFASQARAIVLSSFMEAQLVENVSTSWQTVELDNSYSDAVVVCTYHLQAFNASNPPAVTRLRNITSGSFELKVQGWENSSANSSDVHCLIVEQGAHKLPDGRALEAHHVISDKTSGQYSSDGGWNVSLTEDVTATLVHTYTNPVVLGQVMSYEDARASVIHVNNCYSRNSHPFQVLGSGAATGLCVGKHIGMIASTRNPETIGFIIAEAGRGIANNVVYELARGADSIRGSASPTGNYALSADHTVAVLTQAAEDGGNGSWAVLFGSDALPDGQMKLQVDEEVFAGDTSRRHTTEPVYYWAFSAAELTLQTTLVNDDQGAGVLTDFTLSTTGIDSLSGTSGSAEVTSKPVHPGNYVLGSVAPAGYLISTWVCSGATVTGGNNISLASGDKAICTITFNDKPTVLSLNKQVKNSHGGDAIATDFKLSFDSNNGLSASGVSGSAALTEVAISPGNYTLAEVPVPGYSLNSITCNGSDTDGSDGLTITTGETVVCDFVNVDKGVDLELAKSVSDITPNVGSVLSFTLKVINNGPDVATNLQVVDVVPAGFAYVAASISGGSSVNDSSPEIDGLSWTVASLASGGATSLSFQATVLAP